MSAMKKKWDEEDFKYDYGNLPNLHPSTQLSKDILAKLKKKKDAAHPVLKRMHETWEKVEQKKQLFVATSSLEKKYKADDPSRPLATIIPHMLAANDTLCSAYDKTYNRKVLSRYMGVGSREAEVAAILKERVISESDQFFFSQLHIKSAVEEAFAKGVALIGTEWTKFRSSQQVEKPVTELLETMLKDNGVPDAVAGDFLAMSESEIEFEGTRLNPVDMWNAFIDPSANFNRFNNAQFAGYLYETSPFDLLALEYDPESFLFNCKNARLMCQDGSAEGLDPLYCRPRYGPLGDTRVDSDAVSPAELELLQPTFWVQKLIPKEWGLGDGDQPEIWVFQTIADKLIIQARPTKTDHNMLGFAGLAPTTTGFDIVPLPMLARTWGINEAMDWMVRSRMHEVMSAGAKLLYNPMFVDPKNFLSGRPQAAIPLRPAAYYRDSPVSNYIHQLAFHSATQGHWGDIGALQQIAKDTDGTVDIIKGDLSTLPERPGQGTASNAMSMGLSRVDGVNRTLARQQGHLHYIKGKNLDQYMSEEAFVSAAGQDNQADLRDLFGADVQQVGVMPKHIKGKWRVLPPDEPSESPENFQGQFQMASILFQNPQAQAEILAGVSPLKQYIRLMELGGGKYAKDIMRRAPRNPAEFGAAMMDDATVDAQQAAGNIVPQAQAQQYLQRAR